MKLPSLWPLLNNWQPGGALVLGGARSGKSSFAEALAQQSGRAKIYCATSQVWDDEMGARVETHRARRGEDWRLVEEPLALAATIARYAGSETCLLVDCLTLWLTNLMMAEREIEPEMDNLLAVLSGLQDDASVLLVSNEVGQGIVPMDPMARAFRDHAGRLHQRLAAQLPHTWFVTAGLPQKLK